MMRWVSSIVGGLAPMLAVVAIAHDAAAQKVPGRTARTVVTFDNAGDAPGVPEGITTDGKAGLYVSLFVLDQIWHVDPATGEKKKVADVPGGNLKGDLIGIERDPSDGSLLAAFKKPPRSTCSPPIIPPVATRATRRPASTGSTQRPAR
jgi:hypothetical protein